MLTSLTQAEAKEREYTPSVVGKSGLERWGVCSDQAWGICYRAADAHRCTGAMILGRRPSRAAATSVVLEDGMWPYARSNVSRGVTIDEDSALAAAAPVITDVLTNSMVWPLKLCDRQTLMKSGKEDDAESGWCLRRITAISATSQPMTLCPRCRAQHFPFGGMKMRRPILEPAQRSRKES
jgi:hypothetical protein